MKIPNLFLIVIFIVFINLSGNAQSNYGQTQSTSKPWAYWWWMGSSVTKEGISKNLRTYKEAGFGGMHIIPIYGEKGDEPNYIRYLSPEWMDMLVHTVNEAEKLGMQIDMTSGTGWPFGGPGINYDNSAKAFKIQEISGENIPDSNKILSEINEGTIVNILGINEENSCVDLPFSIDKSGKIKLNSSENFSSLLALIEHPTHQKVKRAAPGGEGLVLDYFDKDALNSYMQPFEKAFNNSPFTNAKVRSFYNDSYEVFGANYTSDLPDKFKNLRGYDLLPFLNVLNDKESTEQKERIVSDYCETISDLLYSEFTIPWVQKSHEMGLITRNQAHGSPGNLLDLYAAADIPETESFGSSGFQIPGVRQDPLYNVENFGRPSPLSMKFASSAAHLKGKDLVASETTTWLADHFKVALSQVKPQVDEVFVSGINHIVFHGITYSPPDKPFPGRLFYASTNFGPHSHFFNELPALNNYIENCQTILQQSDPHNDVLLFFPIHDTWSKRYNEQFLVPMTVHHSDHWLESTDCGKLAKEFWENGFAFDYISDRLLSDATVINGNIHLAGSNYKALVIPECTYISETTMALLLRFASEGVRVLFHNKLPDKVNGYNNYSSREKILSSINNKISQKATIYKDIISGLVENGILNEDLATKGLSYIRKKQDDEIIYFISNLSNQFSSGEIDLSVKAEHVVLYVPLNNKKGKARSRIIGEKTRLLLQLDPGQSCFLFCSDKKDSLPEWNYYSTGDYEGITLNPNWTISPVSGAPAIPRPVKTPELLSWTEFGDSYKYFSGKATYKCNFGLSGNYTGKTMILDLGDVRETAEVRINGRSLGLLWCVPFRILIPPGILKDENTLEITVTNLSFNRVIDLDQKRIEWKNFHEINFVNIRYEKYDASGKNPVPSGLLGPVRIYEAIENDFF